MNPLMMTPETIRVAGHRGHSAGAPENTLAAFRKAREFGGVGVTCETDLAMTSDGELILFHDDTVDRTTNGRGLVSKMTYAEISKLDAGSWFSAEYHSESVPRLRDALQFARQHGIIYQVEIKTYNQNHLFFPKLRALIDELGCADLMQFSSFDFAQLRDLKKAIPEVPTVGISHSRMIDPAALAKQANLDAMNIEFPHFASGEALQLKEAGIAAFMYLPKPELLKPLRAYGWDVRTEVVRWVRDGWMDQLLCDDVELVAAIKDEANGK
ncbi:glycerophosphodiester phosphodiesterase [Pseudomonas syringae]|uniref:glycerophosphodiester phosphodiesterase n=1 Tax=Pseudomonas syringae TaxID=317 RepID=UPI0006B97429|nr:glycerophosphodiester phosphodiesterase family protein [Pseudomonas syringae]MCF5030114.1 phosphodiesterase [Pseudomonas syringae]POD19787.1 phosphodiesterase [Pseudomonas syringae pv. syringae]UQB21728.1 hypothetical protein I9H08_07925 [Pseudomonas syringae pv. syringae]WHN05907.1 glycerophosphodiester phosphodiesterase family protein [Pseudomonas syringae pv. syringae]